MTEIDYACSYFDVPTNFACKALPGEMCVWPDEKGERVVSHKFHPERIEAANAMNRCAGDAPSVEAFEQAAAATLYGSIEDAI